MNPFSPGRTITERDVKHLERHLSMKKTIRKKMMRDLQQAFVDDPKKFTDADENKAWPTRICSTTNQIGFL